MKKIYLLIFFITTTVFAQTIYKVAPDTKGGKIVLSVVNESETSSVSKITVALSNNPRGLDFHNNIVRLNKLNPNEEREAHFTFDTKRIPGTPEDTLKFLITDKNGGSWSREIIFEYSLPKEFKLEQNYPNPFNPSTTIEFAIPQNGRYNISVYNILGQLVELLGADEYAAGYYKVNFDAGRLASGTYIYKLSGSNVNLIKKMLLLK